MLQQGKTASSGEETIDDSASVLAGLSRLAPRLAPGGEAVRALRRLSAGATQELWRFEVAAGDGAVHDLVLRRAPGGDRTSGSGHAGLGAEAALLVAVAQAGVPVPPMRLALAPADGLGHGFVMQAVEGETLGGRIVKSEALTRARGLLPRQCGEALARIHATPLDGLPPLETRGAGGVLAQWEEAYSASGRARPVFDLALRWLEDRRPASGPARLVHGDFRNGNIMVGPEGLVAVLDWELAHLGDPAEDLGWLCVPSWRFGRLDRPVGGFGGREDLYAGYEAAGGAPVDREAMRWWEVFGTLRWGVMCAGMVAAFRGADPSVERAVIARRASETEIDLLTMLDA